jgi:transglutaminase-like putative cysteine protease
MHVMKRALLGGVLLALSAGLAWAGTDRGPTLEALKAVTAEKYPGADAVVVLDETRVNVEESGLSHVERTQLVKVLTEKGAAQYATLRFDYDPASSWAEVRGLTVFREGGTVEEVPAGRVSDLPQPQFMIYWGPRMKVASVPKLNPGDAVEIRTYSKGFVIAYLADGGPEDERYIPPMRGHFYDVVLFQGDAPIVKKTYTVRLPRDKPLKARVYNGELFGETSFEKDSLVYRWWKENVPAVKREPRMVEDTDALPKVVLATVPDWPEKSRWFYHVNEDVDTFAFTDEIKAKADEITRGLKTDEEKRLALLAWTARQIRYSGISMGKGEGYTLHPGTMDFHDRAGVCKDIAGMLITLFRAAGFKNTYPAMTMAGARVEDIPADQFNHCVVATEVAPNEYKLYDPTWCPFSREVWSSAEKPQNYVIGSPRGEVLMETPPAPPSDNFVKVVSQGTLNERGDLSAVITVTAGAYSETNLVWAVVNSPAADVRYGFEQAVARISPAARLTDLSYTDPVDVTRPFRITLKVEVPGHALVTPKGMVFGPPLSRNLFEGRRLTDFVYAVKGKERTYDIFLRATREFVYEDRIALPKGYGRLVSYDIPAKVDGPAAAFEAEARMDGGALLLRERLSVKKKIVPAAEYDNFRKAVESWKTLALAFAAVEKGGRP